MTHPQRITEQQARRQLAAARGALTRALRALDDAQEPSAVRKASANVDAATIRVDAAEMRLDAVLSQIPDRAPFRRQPA